MTKKVKRLLAIVLAFLMIVSANSAVASAWSATVDDGFSLGIETKFFREVNGEWIETTKVVAGETVKARVYVDTDYYANTAEILLYYNTDFFTDSYGSGANTLVVNPDTDSFAHKNGVHGDFRTSASTSGVSDSMVANGYIDSAFDSTHNFFWTWVSLASGSENKMYDGSDWLFEFDLTVKSDATGTGDLFVVPATVVNPTTAPWGAVNVPKGPEGGKANSTVDMWSWTANATVDSQPVSIFEPSSITFYANGGAFDANNKNTYVIEDEAGAIIDATQIPALSKDGYTFAGWVDASVSNPTAADIIPVPTVLAEGDLELNAFWLEGDTPADNGTSLNIYTKIFRLVDGEWVETNIAARGENVKMRVYVETDYYAGPGEILVYYDASVFEHAYGTATHTLVVNDEAGTFTADNGVTGEFTLSQTSADQMVSFGYVDAAFNAEYDAIAISYNYPDTSEVLKITDDGWFCEFDFTIAEDATDIGYFMPVAETVASPSRINGFINVPRGAEGDDASTAVGMWNWYATPTLGDWYVEFDSTITLNSTDGAFDAADADAYTSTGYIGADFDESLVPSFVEDETLTFVGWVDADLGDEYTEADILADLSTVAYEHEDKTYNAVWLENVWVYFQDSEGNDLEDARLVTPGAAFEEVADPALEGHFFVGWSTDGARPVELPAVYPDADTTYIAIWETNVYPLTYYVDGEIVSVVDVEFGTEIPNEIAAFTPADGRTLSALYTDPYYKTPYVGPQNMPAEGVTLYAYTTINTYDAVFYVDDAVYATVPTEYNEPIAAPADPTKEGYVFTGWTPAVGLMDDVNGKEFYATWTPDVFTSTYYVDDEYYDAIDTEYLAAPDAPVDPVKEGYVFKGWAVKGTTNVIELPATMGAADAEYDAIFEIEQYTITYYEEDGTTEYAADTYDFGADVVAPAEPTKEGYTFTGWTYYDAETYDAADLSTAVEVEAPVTMPAYDIAAVPNFEINEYTLTFIVDGEVYDTITGDFGDPVDATTVTDPVKDGYTFTGWSPAVPGTIPSADTDITATWKINEYTATFDPDGGYFNDDTAQTENIEQVYEFDAEITAPADPKKTGYDFQGWTPNPDKMPAADTTYTAVWTPASGTGYVVKTFVMNTDGTYSDEYTTMTAGTGVTGEFIKIYPAYVEGFYVDETVDGEGDAYVSKLQGNILADGTLELVVYYARNEHTLTYDANRDLSDDEDITATDYFYGATVIAPADPEREGYTFAGWTYTYDDNGTTVTLESAPATMLDYDITATANWDVNAYTVTWVVEGQEDVVVEYDFGEAVEALENPTLYGHTFTGWDVTVPATMPAEDVVITAVFAENTYNATFIVDGEEYAVVPTVFGEDVVAPEDPDKTGYTFAGWEPAVGAMDSEDGQEYVATWTANDVGYTVETYYMDTTGAYSATPDSSTSESGFSAETATVEPAEVEGFTLDTANSVLSAEIAADGSTVLVVKYARNQYELVIDPDADVDGDETTETYYYNEKVTAPAEPTKEGYTFAGWVDAIPTTMPADDVTSVAQWTVNEYTITWIDTGVTLGTDTYDYGADVTALEPTKTGYTFLGWGDIMGNIQTVPATMPAENLTYFAQWQKDEYTVTFNVQGTETVYTLGYGDAISAPTAAAKTGYTFDYWSEQDPAVYVNATKATIPATMGEENLYYYAVYKVNSYDAVFDANGGNFSDDTTSKTVSTVYEQIPTAPENPTRAGYAFTGWTPALSAIGIGGATYTATWEALASNYKVETYYMDVEGNYPATADTTETIVEVTDKEVSVTPAEVEGFTVDAASVLTGKVAANGSTTLVVKYARNQYTYTVDVDGTTTSTDYYYGADVTAPEEPKKTGYTFAGWDAAVPATMPAEDVTSVAQWTVNQYTITFDTDGGNEIADITLDYGADVTAPENPTKTGYTFAGWDKEIPAVMPAENTLVTAQWTVNNYTISFGNTGDSTVADINQAYGTAVTAPADPKKTGYTFAGWDAEIPATMPAEDITINATWTVNQYDAVYDLAGGNIEGSTANVVVPTDFGSVPVDPATPVKEGHQFLGWTPARVAMTEAGATYTAVWQTNDYTATFNANGGKFADDSEEITQTYQYNALISTPEAPTKTGYTFGGWTPTVPERMPADNVTYTAVWVSGTDTTYSVVYHYMNTQGAYDDADNVTEIATGTSNASITIAPATPEGFTRNDAMSELSGIILDDGTLVLHVYYDRNDYDLTINVDGTETTTTYFYGAIVSVAEPTKEGYTFAGWVDADDQPVTIPATMPAKDVYAEATWTVNEYTITFANTGDTTIAPITQNFGTAVTAPEAPTWNGYTFAGWDKEIPSTMPNENVTVTAKWTPNTYTITFANTGDSTIADITKAFGEAVEAPEDPTWTGYTFAGWDVAVPATMPAGDMTITALWTEVNYTLSFNTDGGSYVAPITQKFGSAVTDPEKPTKDGYTFAGWDKEIPATMPAENVEFTAQWTPNNYTITFANTGDSTIADITKAYGEAVTAPKDPTWTGYTFTGWDVSVPATMPAGDMTITATWAPNNYTISFNTDGGTAVAPITQAFGTAVTAPAAPTKTGYTFAGWDVAVPATMPAENLVLTAQWTIDQYTITFGNTGDTTIAPITQDYGTVVTAPADPVKKGYTFTGWDNEIPVVMPDSNTTVNATWAINQYTITFENTGDSVIAPITQDYATDVTAPANPTRVGYTFAGWDVAVPATMPAENMTITAKWDANEYTITFGDTGDTVIDPITQDYGTSVNAPADPVKKGYTFTGWDAEIPATMPAEDITVNATWEINQYTITFENTGDTTIAPITQDYATDVTAPEAPKWTGYTFAGWDVSVPATMPAENMTITAQWTVNEYTITFGDTGDTTIDPITQDFGTAITAPTAPEKDGYTFAGWVDEDGNPVEIPATMPAEDMTINASWTPNSYDAVYVVEGTTYATVPTTLGEVPVDPADPTREGYTFAGWTPARAAMTTAGATYTAQWNVNNYTVTYDANGGTNITGYESYTAAYDTPVEAPLNPTRVGYTFAGWVDANNKAVAFPFDMPAYDQTLTATWDAKNDTTYTVNYYYMDTTGAYDTANPIVITATGTSDANITLAVAEVEGFTFDADSSNITGTIAADGTLVLEVYYERNQYHLYTYAEVGDTTAISDTLYYYGATIADPVEPTKTGYTFAGWTPEVPTAMPAADVNAYATWTANDYDALFYGADGELYATVPVTYGEAVTAPAVEPTRTGYTFAGWLDADGNAVDFDANAPIMDENGAEFTADWTINSYKAIFNVDGTEVSAVPYNYEAVITPASDPTKTGYSFAGWAYADDATQTIVTFDAAGPAMGAADVTFVAIWTPVTYNAIFNANGGKYEDDSTSVTVPTDFGATIAVPTAPTKDGYTFTGWVPAVPETMPAGDRTFRAQWSANTYDAVFYAEKDATEAYATVPTVFDTNITVPEAPTKTGYTFAGWVDADGEAIGTPEAMDTVNGETYYATWTVDQYTITFTNTGDSTIAPITQDYGTDVTAPADPVKKGYTFNGWDKEIPETMPAGDMTIAAQWNINQYSITFEDTGDTVIDPIVKDYNASILAPAAPTKEGYEFAGWVDEDGNATTVPITMPAENITIKATWTVKSYNAIFKLDGGNIEGNTADVTVPTNFGEVPVAPADPVKTGYTFSGWAPELAAMTTDGATYTAQWTVVTSGAEFVVDGETYETIDTDFGEAIEAPATDPTKEGYTFNGWLDKDGNVVDFENNAPVMDEDGESFTADWKVNSYNVTFIVDGEVYSGPTATVYGTAITLPATPTKDGYTFATWTPAVPATMPAENLTFTAVWGADGAVYYINVYEELVTGGYSDEPTYVYTMTDGIVGEERGVTNVSVPTGFTLDSANSVLKGEVPATGNLVLKVYLTRNQYTLTKDVDGAKTDSALYYGAEIDLGADPVKEGYTFTGWTYSKTADGTAINKTATMPAYDVTVTANFTINSYTVTFDVNGGVPNVPAVTQEYGTAIAEPAVEPTKEGYEFAGWVDEDGNVVDFSTLTVPAGDITITADWKVKSYSITYVDFNGDAFRFFDNVEYGTAIDEDLMPENEPAQEYYVFKGWNEIPATMPAEDLTIYPIFERVAVKLVAKDGSTTIVDRDGYLEDADNKAGVAGVDYAAWNSNVDTWFIYGLRTKISESVLLNNYITVQGDGSIEVTQTSMGCGTGTVVVVRDNVTNAVVEQFVIVIFGDLNGDASVNATDYSVLSEELAFNTMWSYKDFAGTPNSEYKAYLVKAADLDQNENITANDIQLINEAILVISRINQQTGETTRI